MTVVASNYARKENDLYQTEPWATEALLRQFPVVGVSVWEPAAGNHLIADVLRESGAAEVVTSDIAMYDRRHDFLFDFLRPDHDTDFPGRASQNITVSWKPTQALITNPPYGRGNHDAVRFAQQALRRCNGLVALLLTAKFDFGKTRRHLFRDNPRFMAKVALVDRLSWTLDGETGTEDHAWFVWGPTPRVPRNPTMFWEGRKP
jgi:hypothetical protein